MLLALGISPLLLYVFRYRDPRTGEWVRAGYLAERHEIAERYTGWGITGPAEIRSGAGGVMFSPSSRLAPRADHLPIEEPLVDEPPPESHRTKILRSRSRLSKARWHWNNSNDSPIARGVADSRR